MSTPRSGDTSLKDGADVLPIARRSVGVIYIPSGTSCMGLFVHIVQRREQRTSAAWTAARLTQLSATFLLHLICIMAAKAPAPAEPSYLTSIPSRSAELEETWGYLYDGVEHIMLRLEQGLSFTAYTNLYTTVYNYCTSTKMHTKPDGHGHKGTRRAPL